jgi:hypothetical protein
MQVGDQSVIEISLSYDWTSPGGPSHTDVFVEFNDWTDVAALAPISVGGDANEVRGWVDICCDLSLPSPHIAVLDLAAGATMPSESGRYVLEFSAGWPQGDQTFLFPVNVVPAPSTSGSLRIRGPAPTHPEAKPAPGELRPLSALFDPSEPLLPRGRLATMPR